MNNTTQRPPETLMIRINGVPQGKGRPRFTKGGKAYTPQKTRRYEEAVREAAMLAVQEQGFVKHAAGTPLEVNINAFFPIPASWPKKRRDAMMLGTLYLYPTVKPDADNLAKAILDALNGIAYHDDKQVVYCTVSKRYSSGSNTPCVVVHVAPMKTLVQLSEEELLDGLNEGENT